MANQKISQITEDTSADPTDIVYGTDASGTTDKRFAISTIRGGELASADEEELTLDTPVPGGTTTITIESAIARRDDYRPKIIGDYFQPAPGPRGTPAAPVLNREVQFPVYLPAGVLDRIAIEVTTGIASGIARLGVREDDGTGLPGDLIAEASGTADCSTTGWKILTISATLPTTGRYHLICVTQVAAATLRLTSGPDSMAWVALGTSTPAVLNGIGVYSTHVASQTGALTSTVGSIQKGGSDRTPTFTIRYSS